MNKEDIEKSWKKYANRTNSTIDFQDLDEAFNIIIHFEEKQFSPHNIDKHILYKASNTLSSWVNWAHKRLMPSKNLLVSSESDVLEDREADLVELIDTFQAQLTSIRLANLGNSEEERTKEIENALETWQEMKPRIVSMQQEIKLYWQGEKNGHNKEKNTKK